MVQSRIRMRRGAIHDHPITAHVSAVSPCANAVGWKWTTEAGGKLVAEICQARGGGPQRPSLGPREFG